MSHFTETCYFGGEAGIRTLARVTPSNDLANRPLRPTWVLLHKKLKIIQFHFLLKLFGGESEIRTHGSLTTTPVFKTGALNQLDHLSTPQKRIIFYPDSMVLSIKKP
jgi:hypothetical protein